MTAFPFSGPTAKGLVQGTHSTTITKIDGRHEYDYTNKLQYTGLEKQLRLLEQSPEGVLIRYRYE